MKRSAVLGSGLALVLALIATVTPARESPNHQTAKLRPVEDFRGSHRFSLDQDPSGYPAAAPGDTHILASYSFDLGGFNCTNDSWIALDLTAQLADFFHVAQASGGVSNELNGGDFGRLVPVRGNKSLWCGAYANYPTNPPAAVCRYASLPGYGNDWNQAFRTKGCLSVLVGVSVTFLATWDSEPGYDGTTIEIDECDDAWIPAGEVNSNGGQFEGIAVDSLHTHLIPDSLHSGSLRIRFHFESDGAWSDEEAMWDTDGAILIDSLSVSDAGGLLLAVEDFEDEAEGATSANDWVGDSPPGYGDYSGLIGGYQVIQEDPCRSEITCMWNFFTGSPDNYACGGFPNQPVLPGVNDEGQYLHQAIRSPLIPWAGNGAGAYAELEFTTYRDLAFNRLIVYTWGVASNVDGCAGPFRDRQWVYWGGQKDWFTAVYPFGDLVEPGATDIQIQLGVKDMCPVWCGIWGSGSCHSHSPLFDEVVVRRIETKGPLWNVRDMDLFQDTFAEDGTINPTSTGRADAAADINPFNRPAIRPGDSVTVSVSDPDNGLATDPFTGSGAAVYAYVAVWPRNQPGKSGAALTQDSFRWPVVDSLWYEPAHSWIPGNTWYRIRMDTSFTDGTARTGARPDAFCVDLNDNLFAVGDTIEFFFGAESANTGIRTYWSPFTGRTKSMTDALEEPDEFQILPGGGYTRGGEILYVDAFDGRGAQPFFDQFFRAEGIDDEVDRYDVRSPSSSEGNGPGARVQNVFDQIIAPYDVILWNTGDLSAGLIGDGTGKPSKSDDAFVLFTFIDQNPEYGGIYFSGDDIADELYNKYNPGVNLVNLRTYIQGAVHYRDNDANAQGFTTAPLCVGEPGSTFDHVLGPDELYAYGGCPLINDFDVITPTGSSVLEMNYGGDPGQSRGAVISQVSTNTAGTEVAVMLSGFSFHTIRNVIPDYQMAHWHHLDDILLFLGQAGTSGPHSADSPPYTNSLAQNYPNPFNPTTAIQFTVRERTPVRLNVYNVAGQRVRTLLDEMRAPDVVHTVEWDGRNNAGQAVASGVYFYRLVTTEFTQTRKMVLLK